MPTSQFRISFCTVAMGRLDQLRQTLPRNIADTEDYADAEFVVLDYGSADGLADWIRKSCSDWIAAGRLTYLRVDGVSHYDSTHSRNICFLAATGAVLCNTDADNYLTRGFASYVNDLMNRHPRAIANFGRAPHSSKGRLAMFRQDFIGVGGYDESFVGYGFEDKDLRARLLASGCSIQWFNSAYASFIPHCNRRRVEHLPPAFCNKRTTNQHNCRLSRENLAGRRLVANAGRIWGKASVTRNHCDLFLTGFQHSHGPANGDAHQKRFAGRKLGVDTLVRGHQAAPSRPTE